MEGIRKIIHPLLRQRWPGSNKKEETVTNLPAIWSLSCSGKKVEKEGFGENDRAFQRWKGKTG
ncbi:hypothetical protein J7M02_03010 [Candidatus Aerophobetes bacterium]|nr:hypothetical protein [Candidatus Aerophobetes bacterium]